jgi:hypothetical protein
MVHLVIINYRFYTAVQAVVHELQETPVTWGSDFQEATQ